MLPRFFMDLPGNVATSLSTSFHCFLWLLGIQSGVAGADGVLAECWRSVSCSATLLRGFCPRAVATALMTSYHDLLWLLGIQSCAADIGGVVVECFMFCHTSSWIFARRPTTRDYPFAAPSLLRVSPRPITNQNACPQDTVASYASCRDRTAGLFPHVFPRLVHLYSTVYITTL